MGVVIVDSISGMAKLRYSLCLIFSLPYSFKKQMFWLTCINNSSFFHDYNFVAPPLTQKLDHIKEANKDFHIILLKNSKIEKAVKDKNTPLIFFIAPSQCVMITIYSH
jgi:hypothetical protein